jgi:hypothetical protein
MKIYQAVKKLLINRHYNVDKEKYDLFVSRIREDKFNESKSVLYKAQSIFQSVSVINETASHALSHLIVINSKPFIDVKFIQ